MAKLWTDKDGNEHYVGVCEIHPYIKVTSVIFKNGGGGGKPCEICTRKTL